LSAGVTVHEVGRAPSDTYRAADEALYAAKATGRDQTISRVMRPMTMHQPAPVASASASADQR